MTNSRMVALMLVFFLAGPAAAETGQFLRRHPVVADALTLLDLWIEQQRLYEQIPGIAIGVVFDRELIWSKGYGVSDLESQTPMTPATLFRIGSVTKVFTATAIMQLRDQGKLRLDDPISRHLPEFTIQNPFPNAPSITVWHLLTHTAGLPREAAFPYFTEHEFPDRDEILAAMATQTLVHAPGTHYKYSNLGMFVLGALIEEVSGESYQDYISRHIFSPLEMRHSSVDPPKGKIDLLATAYMRRQPDGSRQVMDYYETRGMAAAGSIVSSVEDMARFAALNLRREDSTADGEVLSTSTLREMHRPHWVYEDWTGGMGLGFRVAYRNGRTTVSHGGWIGDHRAHLLIVPADRLAVIVITNAGDGVPHTYSYEAYDVVGPAITASVAPPTPEKKTDEAWNRYVGLYTDPWGWESRVMTLDGDLVIYEYDYPPEEHAEDGLTRLEYVEGDTFEMPDGETVVFELDEGGEVVRIRKRYEYLYPVN